MEDEQVFREEVKAICTLYAQAQELHDRGVHVVSVDEKTGIQALERQHPTKPVRAGQVERIEYEYQRHGTQVLTANFEIATGHVIAPTVADTRKEEDFVKHIEQMLDTNPEGEWVIICDQLNTHKSAGLVKAIAKACGISEDLGIKGRSGILKSMASRADFLIDETHRIRLVYTPKHCSWLKIWFSILTRRLLKRGHFASTSELKRRILGFIVYFNEILAKPFRWTYQGKPLVEWVIRKTYDALY